MQKEVTEEDPVQEAGLLALTLTVGLAITLRNEMQQYDLTPDAILDLVHVCGGD